MALSELCSILRSQGYDAKLFFAETLSQNEDEYKYERDTFVKTGLKSAIAISIWKLLPFKRIADIVHLNDRIPLHAKGRSIKLLPFFSKKHTILIYPETVYGNPLKAQNVVRWQLYHYKFSKDNSAFSKSDLFIGYREIFNDRAFTPNIENIHIFSFNDNLYKRFNYGQRTGKCYIIRKGGERLDLPTHFDGPVIDDLPEDGIVRVFNQCEYCYSYDTQTFYSSIAALCGCKSVVLPEPGKSMGDYRTENEPSYGVAWGDSQDEIDRAIGTVSLLEARIRDFQEKNCIEAEHLVKILENHFNTRIRKIRGARHLSNFVADKQ